jgi:hypothetical protein
MDGWIEGGYSQHKAKVIAAAQADTSGAGADKEQISWEEPVNKAHWKTGVE